MQHEIVKVISKLVLNIAKSRQSIQDKNLTQDYLFTGTTEEPCVLPWEQSRPDHVWVPHLPLLLAQGSVWFIYNHCLILSELLGAEACKHSQKTGKLWTTDPYLHKASN